MAKISLTISILNNKCKWIKWSIPKVYKLNFEKDFSLYLQAISVYFYIKTQETRKKNNIERLKISECKIH